MARDSRSELSHTISKVSDRAQQLAGRANLYVPLELWFYIGLHTAHCHVVEHGGARTEAHRLMPAD